MDAYKLLTNVRRREVGGDALQKRLKFVGLKACLQTKGERGLSKILRNKQRGRLNQSFPILSSRTL